MKFNIYSRKNFIKLIHAKYHIGVHSKNLADTTDIFNKQIQNASFAHE